MDNKKKNTLISISFVCVILLSFFAGFFVRTKTYQSEINTLDYILSMYKKYYYEQSGVDKDAVDAFCSGLFDEYSDYYTKEEYDIIYKSGQGIKQGVGMSLYQDSLVVYKTSYNSPAERAGIRAGDSIVGIELGGVKYTINSPSEFYEIYDKVPEYVDFSLFLSRGNDTIAVTLQRSQFIETYVRYYDLSGEYGFNTVDGSMQFLRIGDNEKYDLLGKENVAVIEYTGFQASAKGLNGSAGQMSHALEFFSQQNKTDLIIDLRNNGGGKMDILCDVVSHFLDVPDGEKPLICYAQDKHGKRENFYSVSTNFAKYNFKSIQILANANSASASEAFIGAVLDYDSADIVNVILEPFYTRTIVDDQVVYMANYRTYGKGIMQTTYENISGGAIKLTTAGLFWPVTGVSIHQKGVTTSLNDSVYGSKQKILNASQNGCVYDAVSSK